MIIIDDKEYKEEDLSEQAKSWIYTLNDMLNNRKRYISEIEKIDVLSSYYRDRIKKDIADSENVKDSGETSKDTTKTEKSE